MKKSITIIIAIMLLVLLVGCGTKAPAGGGGDASGASGEKLKFMFVMPMAANEVWSVAAIGFEEGCAAIGAEAIVVSPAKDNDYNDMNALVETGIAEKIDGLVTQGLNPEAQAAAFTQMDAAGIPYVLINSDAADSNRLAFVGTGDDVGRVGGKAIADFWGNEKIYFVTGIWDLTAPVGISLHNAYLKSLEENAAGGFEEVVTIHTGADILKAVSEWTTVFMTYPEVNAGANIDGFGAIGAARAMIEVGYQKGDVCMIGIDDVPETLDLIKEGWLYGTMTQNFYRMGYQPVMWLEDFVKNGNTPAEKVNDSGTMLVTVDNLETYGADMRNPALW